MFQVDNLLKICRTKGITLVTAESCTGGMIAASITDIAGSSNVFDRGFVTYSNAAKTDMLGVPADMIVQYGAVSAQVAKAMASGAITHSQANLSVAVTGIAGPSGGSDEKPVGTVYIGICLAGEPATAHRHQFSGNRAEIRQQTVLAAILLIEETAHLA